MYFHYYFTFIVYFYSFGVATREINFLETISKMSDLRNAGLQTCTQR